MRDRPECIVQYDLPSAQSPLTLQFSLYLEPAATDIGPKFWSTGGGFLWPYFDLYNQLHIYCTTNLCGELIDDIYGHDPLAPHNWYTVQMEIVDDAIKVTVYHGDTISEATAYFSVTRVLHFQSTAILIACRIDHPRLHEQRLR